jgi:hypothetical protein
MKNYEKVSMSESLYDHIAERLAAIAGGDPDDFREASFQAVSYISEVEAGSAENSKHHYQRYLEAAEDMGVGYGEAYDLLFKHLEAPR